MKIENLDFNEVISTDGKHMFASYETEIIAETTFEGWVNFGTKNQVYRKPQVLETVKKYGVFSGYLLDGVEILKEDAKSFIDGCKIEIKHGLGNAKVYITTFEELFALHGITK